LIPKEFINRRPITFAVPFPQCGVTESVLQRWFEDRRMRVRTRLCTREVEINPINWGNSQYRSVTGWFR
jgi:hypothetical protein